MDIFVMLEELLEQDQFELLPAKEGDTERRLVYLMNDAVESFLVFRGAALTGHYLEDYEGALTWSMSRDAARYVLVVRQGDNAVTLLFENLDLEVHLYNYGEIAHFWVPGYEYLRQLEYRNAASHGMRGGGRPVVPAIAGSSAGLSQTFLWESN